MLVTDAGDRYTTVSLSMRMSLHAGFIPGVSITPHFRSTHMCPYRLRALSPKRGFF
jgi:hypothetical protein